MRLTIVGSAGSYPSPESACSCYLVEADGFRLVMDLGNGALGALQRYASLYEIDAVLLTHLHADHCLDMTSYFVARNYRHGGCPELLPVYGPSGTAERLSRAYGMPQEPGLDTVFDFRTVRGGESFRVGPFTVVPERVAHPVEAYGFRVEHGGVALAYSGDTGPCDGLERLADGADLLLAEASFLDGRDSTPDLHLNGREAGETAARGAAKRLVLTHIPVWTDPGVNRVAAEAAYPGPVDVAVPGDVYEI
ncbi:MBL fold metallo-hydrolase [Mangrovactinospora gilvigrisea]|uniref:MBL fold metallo-hydrolase n=1 Tax=Mangrovactinospora gilvigrisea TaxID=1428644 RepID=A0A1J7C799_9ACTN|nr:MBL fold metallo-hydrolase [Mangrovactinospora gilvigrisea]OIV37404.1 MBL fold metallo-hydrolase [Mangrovactinospora gilvigrisea]